LRINPVEKALAARKSQEKFYLDPLHDNISEWKKNSASYLKLGEDPLNDNISEWTKNTANYLKNFMGIQK